MDRNQPSTEQNQTFQFLQQVIDENPGSSKSTDSDKENEYLATNDENNTNNNQSNTQDNNIWKDFFYDNDMKKDIPNSKEIDFDIQKVLGISDIEEEPSLTEEKTENVETENNNDIKDEKEEEVIKTVEEVNNVRQHDSDIENKTGINIFDNELETTQNKKGRRKKKTIPKRKSKKQPVQNTEDSTSLDSQSTVKEREATEAQSRQMDSQSDTSTNLRRIGRRKLAGRPKCAGPKVSGDVLQRKYEELHTLIISPYVDSLALECRHTQEQLRRLHGMSVGFNRKAHDSDTRLPPHARQTVQSRVNKPLEKGEVGYSALRSLQVTSRSRPHSAHPRRKRTQHQNMSRPQSAGTLRTVSRYDSTRSNVSNISKEDRNYSDAGNSRRGMSRKVNRWRSSSSNSEQGQETQTNSDGSRSKSRSPDRIIQHTDNHLKNSPNPLLKKWLLQKNKELKKQKAEERRKKKEERERKQMEIELKLEMEIESKEKVKEWMRMKRREAYLEQKRQDKIAEKSVEDPALVKPRPLGFVPVIRPETSGKTAVVLADTLLPKPPASKFVYKRPVSGRVRLIKHNQEKMKEARETDENKAKLEKENQREKTRKMRVTYDQWLLKKREDDYERRKEKARLKALSKSESELEKLFPEMARKRIADLRRGKKRIETGIEEFDDETNRSFGGVDICDEDENSHSLSVSGSLKSLKPRPASAKLSTKLDPQKSKSPRRPKSAYPIIGSETEANETEKNSFVLPFPEEKGAPYHVIAKQKKLFSLNNFSSRKSLKNKEKENFKNEENRIKNYDVEQFPRPEPQGADDQQVITESNLNSKSSFFITDAMVDDLVDSVVGKVAAEEDKVNKKLENNQNKLLEDDGDKQNVDNFQLIDKESDLNLKSQTENQTPDHSENEIKNLLQMVFEEIEDEVEENDDQETNLDETAFNNNTENQSQLDNADFSKEKDNKTSMGRFAVEADDFNNEIEESEQITEVADNEKLSTETPEECDNLDLHLDLDQEDSEELNEPEDLGSHVELESEVRESKTMSKHVSFSDEATVYEDHMVGDSNDVYSDDEEYLDDQVSDEGF